MREIVTLLNNS